jgi:hypothetical protein
MDDSEPNNKSIQVKLSYKLKQQEGHTIQQEEFEDTTGVIRIRKSKKNRQHNGQANKYKKTNNDIQNIHLKLKIE